MLEDTFGDIIQKARQGLGWSLEKVAKEASLPSDTIARLEGDVAPTALQSDALAKALELEPARLRAIAENRYQPRAPSASSLEDIVEIKGYIGTYEVKCYLLIDNDSREAALIDTANNPRLVLERLRKGGLRLTMILMTHCHHDHVGGVDDIRKETGAKVAVYSSEMPLYRAHARRDPDLFVAPSAEVRIGRHRLAVIETPGHTPGGTTYWTGKVAFVGDALFAGSTGRSMSPEGYRSLLSSIRKRVLTLPPETTLFPGHGPATTVREENVHNPFFG